MSELLLEIGMEEIPSNYLTSAIASLEKVASDILTKYRLPFENIYVDGTPRRLVLHVDSMKSSQEALKRTVIGPPKRISYDAEGKPTQAAIGFAKSQNVSMDKVYVEKKDRGEYLAVVVEENRLKTKKILAEALPEIISSISFPKTMRGGGGQPVLSGRSIG
ncbi:MAG: glycine--tRNA ligase subunit beta [Nitrospinae bacterium]|nr:glycine--tRNA ligase subunit beta [Nitrospinota bacterium]